MPLETDAWGLDVVITSSHKALMCPPGLAFASVSERAFETAREAASPRYYFDWERTRAKQEKARIRSRRRSRSTSASTWRSG